MPPAEDRKRLAHLMQLVATIGVVVGVSFGLLYVGLGSPLAVQPHRQDASDAAIQWMRVGNVAAVTVMAVLLALSAERARAAPTDRLEAANAALALARDAADAANRAKSEVMANVSRELRTPLHAVIGMTDLLLHGALDADQREQARVARAAAAALDELISDVLDATRLDARALELVLAPCDVGAVVRRVVDMVRARAQERGLAIELQVARSPCALMCDEGRVRQIITILVDNAVKFTFGSCSWTATDRC